MQATLGLLQHFGSRGLTLRHLKILMAVEFFCRLTKGKAYPSTIKIAQYSGVDSAQFECELRELVELKYLHEMVPTYGSLILTYKLGAKGGSMMRKFFGRKGKKRDALEN